MMNLRARHASFETRPGYRLGRSSG